MSKTKEQQLGEITRKYTNEIMEHVRVDAVGQSRRAAAVGVDVLVATAIDKAVDSQTQALQGGLKAAIAIDERQRREIVELENRSLAYLCTVCGGFGYVKIESLDCGTTFTCDSCGGKTVVNLQSVDEYCDIIDAEASKRITELEAELDEAAKCIGRSDMKVNEIEAESNQLWVALRRLEALKYHKDVQGKTEYYRREQPLAWVQAHEALAGRKKKKQEKPE